MKTILGYCRKIGKPKYKVYIVNTETGEILGYGKFVKSNCSEWGRFEFDSNTKVPTGTKLQVKPLYDLNENDNLSIKT